MKTSLRICPTIILANISRAIAMAWVYVVFTKYGHGCAEISHIMKELNLLLKTM